MQQLQSACWALLLVSACGSASTTRVYRDAPEAGAAGQPEAGSAGSDADSADAGQTGESGAPASDLKGGAGGIGDTAGTFGGSSPSSGGHSSGPSTGGAGGAVAGTGSSSAGSGGDPMAGGTGGTAGVGGAPDPTPFTGMLRIAWDFGNGACVPGWITRFAITSKQTNGVYDYQGGPHYDTCGAILESGISETLTDDVVFPSMPGDLMTIIASYEPAAHWAGASGASGVVIDGISLVRDKVTLVQIHFPPTNPVGSVMAQYSVSN